MALQLTLSCDLDKSQSGPTLIHSTGVQDYQIPPEVIRTLQENISNDLLSNHSDGVLCQEGPQRVLAVLRQNGFTLQKQITEDQRALWILTQGGGGGGNVLPPVVPQPTPTDENNADAGNEDQGGEEEGGEEEGGEEEEEGEE